jgi:hypothetical protein
MGAVLRLKKRSVAARLHVTRLLHRMPPGSAILGAFGGLAHQSAKRAYVSRQLFVRQAATCKRHSAQRKPRGCSACMHTGPPYTAIILSPELNCGFTSDRPFACFFQKTDVIRNSYTRRIPHGQSALRYTKQVASNRPAKASLKSIGNHWQAIAFSMLPLRTLHP